MLRKLMFWRLPSAAEIRAKQLDDAMRELAAAEHHADYYNGMTVMLRARIKRLEKAK